MAKNIQTKEKDKDTEDGGRWEEIAAMRFGALSDDDVLRLLAERKRLLEVRRERERQEKEKEEQALLEKKKAEALEEAAGKKKALEKEIEELNRSISPDKADDELLSLIARRRELEKKLENGGDIPSQPSVTVPAESAPAAAAVVPAAASAAQVEEAPEERTVQPDFQASVKPAFGQESILKNDFAEGSELHRYAEQLKNNTGSLGTLLQGMPLAAKANKEFMLRVAEIDPAYAMHYAADTLKKNADFNIRIASMKNPRHSGNALVEMLPEARSSAVVLAAVKQDYRNIRFAQPDMEAYDEMLGIAKSGALERIKDLKEATDTLLLIPKLLQADKQFMAEVKEITAAKPAAGRASQEK